MESSSPEASRGETVFCGDRSEERVKVHYIGYESSYNEWETGELEVYGDGFQLESYVPFSLYSELQYQIKRGLTVPAKEIQLSELNWPLNMCCLMVVWQNMAT